MSLWSEAKLNVNISASTRLYLINTTIHLIFLLYDEYIKHLPSKGSMKNTVGCSQLFLSIDKIIRFFPSLLAESFAIHNYCENLALDRVISHPWKNRIGNIRNNHSLDNDLNSTARFEFVKDSINGLNLAKERRTRLNINGCRTNVGELIFDFQMSETQLAELIMKVGYYKNESEVEFDF